MHLKHAAVTAAVAAVAVPTGVFVAGAGAASPIPGGGAGAVAAKAPTVAVRGSKRGRILVVGSTGRTLYLYAADGRNKSNCTGSCAQIWPPLMVSGRPSAGSGVSASKLGEIRRGRGNQVTYAGHPLYTFASDTAAGQISGEGVQSFYIVSPSGSAIR